MKSRIKKKITVYSRVRGARRVSLERARERERANSVKERVIWSLRDDDKTYERETGIKMKDAWERE